MTTTHVRKRNTYYRRYITTFPKVLLILIPIAIVLGFLFELVYGIAFLFLGIFFYSLFGYLKFHSAACLRMCTLQFVSMVPFELNFIFMSRHFVLIGKIILILSTIGLICYGLRESNY